MADMELEMVNLASLTQLPSSNMDTKRVLRRLVLKLEVFGSLGGFSMVFHIYMILPYNVIVGPPVRSWFINSMNTTVISIVNHSDWSFVHQLKYRTVYNYS